MMDDSDKDCTATSKPVTPQCTCKSLKATDVPGAVLPKTPEKCKVNELRVWLKSRSQRVKSKETKSELVVRVKKCLEQVENLQIVDPHPDQPYLAKMTANCQLCSPEDFTTKNIPDQPDKTTAWTQNTNELPRKFSYLDILNYSKKSGKNTNYIEKPIEKGYAFYFDGYVFNQEVGIVGIGVIVKARCYKSMKKSETPHSLKVTLSSAGAVTNGMCTCVAGAGGHCNHVYALLYSIDHVLKLKVEMFPRTKTCTDKPAEWVKSRTDGVRSEPVMTSTVIKPKYGSTSKGIRSTLYEARSGDAKYNLVLPKTMSCKLSEINPLFGVCLTAGNQAQSMGTRMDFSVPTGSPLSYQLSVTEGNFSVSANVPRMEGKKTESNSSVPNFPWSDTTIEGIPVRVLAETGLSVSDKQATYIYLKTITQSSCQLWHDVRKHRLTASTFGAIIR